MNKKPNGEYKPPESQSLLNTSPFGSLMTHSRGEKLPTKCTCPPLSKWTKPYETMILLNWRKPWWLLSQPKCQRMCKGGPYLVCRGI